MQGGTWRLEQSTTFVNGDATMRPLIQARNLEKIYKTGDVKTYALCGVDLTVHAGEFTAADQRCPGFFGLLGLL